MLWYIIIDRCIIIEIINELIDDISCDSVSIGR